MFTHTTRQPSATDTTSQIRLLLNWKRRCSCQIRLEGLTRQYCEESPAGGPSVFRPGRHMFPVRGDEGTIGNYLSSHGRLASPLYPSETARPALFQPSPPDTQSRGPARWCGPSAGAGCWAARARSPPLGLPGDGFASTVFNGECPLFKFWYPIIPIMLNTPIYIFQHSGFSDLTESHSRQFLICFVRAELKPSCLAGFTKLPVRCLTSCPEKVQVQVSFCGCVLSLPFVLKQATNQHWSACRWKFNNH